MGGMANTETTSSPGLPPGILLYQLSIGHYVSRALHLAAKLGIADLLADGPRDAESLAAAVGGHAPALRRVLRLLASVGVLTSRRTGALRSHSSASSCARTFPARCARW